MDTNIDKKKLLLLLTDHKIDYELHEHEALYTVDDSIKKRGEINGVHSKNLFLKNKKNRYFLLSCHEEQSVNLKKLKKIPQIGNVSFAKKEKLLEMMNLLPGSVSPFGLLNDRDRSIEFFLDKKIALSNKINYHPMENTSTITIATNNFIRFFVENNIKVNIFDFSENIIIKEPRNE